MKILLSVICLLLLTSCGPSQEELRQAEMEQQRLEKEKANRIAAVTCAVMGETKNMDGAVRVEKINEAREKIGAEPFLRGDSAIKEAFEWGLCQELVLNENYDERLQELKDALAEIERIDAEQRAEERRIAAEKRAEEERIAAEKRRIAAEKRAGELRIADSKPTVKEEFYYYDQLKSRRNFQSKNDGGKLHGLTRHWHENGQLGMEATFKDGSREGLTREWHENGQLENEYCYSNGKRVDMSNCQK